MQENNLEGKVHNIMEGFTIEPSEKVWGNIQADLAGNKKTRFGMLPAAVLIICFLLTTFLLHDLEIKKPTSAASVNSGITQTKPSLKNTPANLNQNELAIISSNKKTNTTGNKNFSEINLNDTKQISVKEKNKNTATTKNKITNQHKELVAANDDVETPEKKDIQEAATEEVITINYPKKDSTQQTIVSGKDLIKIDSTTVKEEKQEQKINNTKTVTTKKKNNKWEFFAVVSGGKFFTGNSYLGQIANAQYYGSYLDMTNSNGVPPLNSSGYFQPSTVKSGISFSVVLKASKKLSTKTSLSVGVGYQNAGTYIRTGNPLSGVLERSFATGSMNEYHNKYHFVQVPVELQSLIGKGKKLPLYWNAGISFSRLFSADALQFDRLQGRYFNDNSYFNKNIMGLSAGLSFAILKKQQPQWLIGPQFYYSLIPVGNRGLYYKTHYSFLGIQLQRKL